MLEKKHTNENLMTAQDVAAYLGNCSTRTIQRLAKDREIPSVRCGTHPRAKWLFRKEDIDAWLKACTKYHETGT